MKNIIILIILGFLKPLDTAACKCMSMPPLSFFDIQKSDLAFIGTCQKIITLKNHNYAIFNVSLLLKGNPKFQTKVTVLSSNNGSGDCMQTFYVGQKWFVIAKRTIFGYYPNHCDNNELVTGDALTKIREVAPGYPFSDKADTDFFYDKNEIRIKGKLVKGKEESYWYYYYRNQLRYKILYHNGRVKELHNIDKNSYKLVLFKNGDIIRVKDVFISENREAYFEYTPNGTIIRNFINGKFDYKLTIDSETHDMIVVNKKGAILGRNNYFEEFKYYPGGHINPVYQFFMRDCLYLDKG